MSRIFTVWLFEARRGAKLLLNRSLEEKKKKDKKNVNFQLPFKVSPK